MIQEFDSVVLTKPLPEEGLRTGSHGAVVAVYRGGEGYEVEFFDDKGRTISVVTVSKDMIKPVAGFNHVEHRA